MRGLAGTRTRQISGRGGSLRESGRFSRNIERDKGITRVEGTTVSFTGATNTIADSGNGLGGFVVGQKILVSGAAQNANNGIVEVATVAAGELTVIPTGKLVDESAGANIEVRVA